MSPETIDAMLAAGASADVIAAAWKAELTAQSKKTEHRRAKDRARQQRHRSRGVTRTKCDPAPNDIDILTPTRENPEAKASVQKSVVEDERQEAIGTCLRKAFPLPDWMPESYAEFRAMRKSMRNVPFGEGAERRVIAKITRLRAEGHDPEKLLSKAIENGHRTVFEDEKTKAAAGTKRLTTDEQIASLKKSIEFYSRMNKPDEVAECRRRIAKLEGGTGPPEIAGLVRGASESLRAA